MTDLTNVIDGTEAASVIAHMLVRLAPEPIPGPQPACVEPVLTALLDAACPRDTGRGIDWVYDLLATTGDATLADSVAAAGARTDTCWLRHCDGLEPRERRRVMIALRHAVGTWTQRRQSAAS